MCNPPFFLDKFERNQRRSSVCPINDSEEVTEGGEACFLERYMQESVMFKDQVGWFTCMVGKRSSSDYAQTYLKTFIAGHSCEDHVVV